MDAVLPAIVPYINRSITIPVTVTPFGTSPHRFRKSSLVLHQGNSPGFHNLATSLQLSVCPHPFAGKRQCPVHITCCANNPHCLPHGYVAVTHESKVQPSYKNRKDKILIHVKHTGTATIHLFFDPLFWLQKSGQHKKSPAVSSKALSNKGLF